ncbi:MAG: hypothetical protein U5R06_13775 [candidate division KSB1 bacterium]|nr:hypothetical protein [candidate division KSB1 bacterium]
MPVAQSGTIQPVVRDIFVYKAARNSDVEQVGFSAFFRKIKTDPIARIQSDKSGFFQVSLAPGIYSFFVMENSLFYANSVDSQGYIQAARVYPDSVSHRPINITYKATF